MEERGVGSVEETGTVQELVLEEPSALGMDLAAVRRRAGERWTGWSNCRGIELFVKINYRNFIWLCLPLCLFLCAEIVHAMVDMATTEAGSSVSVAAQGK